MFFCSRAYKEFFSSLFCHVIVIQKKQKMAFITLHCTSCWFQVSGFKFQV